MRNQTKPVTKSIDPEISNRLFGVMSNHEESFRNVNFSEIFINNENLIGKLKNACGENNFDGITNEELVIIKNIYPDLVIYLDDYREGGAIIDLCENLINPKPDKKEALVVAFQDFNGVYLAKISNSRDKETHAFGATKCIAEQNAITNYNLKYNTPYYKM